MPQAPFYKVYIGDRDISEYVERFHYEDCMEEDSYLELTIKSNFAQALADDPDIVAGTWLSFHFGFIGGEISDVHKAKVTDIKHRYAERVTMTVKCLDSGTVMRKASNQKVWNKKTASDIAKEIATKYGLEFEGKDTSKVYDSLPQGNMADLHFLQYLAQREDGGNYVVYIRNYTLYFTPRNLLSESIKTYTYGDGDGSILSFEPEIRESSMPSVSTEAETKIVDAKKAQISVSKVDNTTETKTGTLGEYKRVYSGNGKQVGTTGVKKHQSTSSNSAPSVKRQLVLPVKDKKEADNIANSKKKAAVLKSLVARLLLNGDPRIIPNQVITVKNVAKTHSGNWYVVKVSTDISASGYVTSLDLNKNGTSLGNASKTTKTTVGTKGTKNAKNPYVVPAGDSNKTVGPDKQKSTVKVRVYDGNKNRL